MRIKNISLRNFRKFQEISFDLSTQVVILGPNGSGKTTLAEACALVLGGRSFRTADLKECIREGAPYAFVKAILLQDDITENAVTVGMDRKGQRKILRDEQPVTRRSLIDTAPFVVCTQEDIDMVAGSPKRRRDFLDKVAMGQERAYIDILTPYLRFIKQKNALLKSGKTSGLSHLNEAAVPFIGEIRRRRQIAADAVTARFTEVAGRAGVDIAVEIRLPAETDETEIRTRLRERSVREKERGCLLYGPHLDEAHLSIKGRVARLSSSGEIAFGAFCLRIAEASLLRDCGWPPVFIADEIFSFMDTERRAKAMSLLEEFPIQTVSTFHREKEHRWGSATQIIKL